MATATEPTSAVRTKGRILIVDDELVVRDSLGKWFVSEGYAARPAGGAREALEMIQQMQFDIALIDIKMPDRPFNAVRCQPCFRRLCDPRGGSDRPRLRTWRGNWQRARRASQLCAGSPGPCSDLPGRAAIGTLRALSNQCRPGRRRQCAPGLPGRS